MFTHIYVNPDWDRPVEVIRDWVWFLPKAKEATVLIVVYPSGIAETHVNKYQSIDSRIPLQIKERDLAVLLLGGLPKGFIDRMGIADV